MEQFQRICLVHYHEIGLKGHNRVTFEMRLLKNLQSLLKEYPVLKIIRISGRLCVIFKADTPYETALDSIHVICCVPGVARVSCGYKVERDLAVMSRAGIQCLKDFGPFGSFKVHARRNHTDFETDSMAMNRLIGSDLCDAFPDIPVKMKDPDATVYVEVVQNASYVYAQTIPAIGGLPVGTAGKVVCLLSSGIDSPVSLWRIARRGAVCIGVHFSGRPQTADTSEYLVDDIAHVLEKSGCISKVYVVPFGDIQKEIALSAPPQLRIVLYRRLMYMVAERIAKREHAGALVTGESLGQVASQTLDNIRATDQAVSLPVLRPLIGSDKVEIIAQAQQLGTFDISSIEAPDCCTLFMPRNPETHAKIEDVLAAEADMPLERWIDECVNAAEKHIYDCPACK